VDNIAWSLVLSDVTVASIKVDGELLVLVNEEAEAFAKFVIPLAMNSQRLYCSVCGAPVSEDNLGQLTLHEEGFLTAKCAYCLDQEIIRTIRRLKSYVEISPIPKAEVENS